MGNLIQRKSNGSAITYARRYSVLLAFGLATTDNDGESLTDDVHAKISGKVATALTEAIKNKGMTIREVQQVLSKYGVTRIEDINAVDLPDVKKDFEV